MNPWEPTASVGSIHANGKIWMNEYTVGFCYLFVHTGYSYRSIWMNVKIEFLQTSYRVLFTIGTRLKGPLKICIYIYNNHYNLDPFISFN